MDKAERWLKENDPMYQADERKQLDYPYLTMRQIQHRSGSSNIVGKETACSNLYPLKLKLGFSDRHGKADENVRQILSLID